MVPVRADKNIELRGTRYLLIYFRFKHITAAPTSVVVSPSTQSATKSDIFHHIGTVVFEKSLVILITYNFDFL